MRVFRSYTRRESRLKHSMCCAEDTEEPLAINTYTLYCYRSSGHNGYEKIRRPQARSSATIWIMNNKRTRRTIATNISEATIAWTSDDSWRTAPGLQHALEAEGKSPTSRTLLSIFCCCYWLLAVAVLVVVVMRVWLWQWRCCLQ